MDVKRTALDAANAKKQDSDVLNSATAVVDVQISIKAILPRGGSSVDFEHIIPILFRKYIKFAINLYRTWPYLENVIFHPMVKPRELFCPRGPMHSCALTCLIVMV